MSKTIEYVAALRPGVTISLKGGGGKLLRYQDGESELVRADTVLDAQIALIRKGGERIEAMLEIVEQEAEGDDAEDSTGDELYTPVGKKVKDVVDHLKSLDDEDEVKRIQALEKGSAKRATILDWSPEPPPAVAPIDGYDDLDEGQITAILAARKGDAEFVASVKAYEGDHAKRAAILEYAEDSTGG